MTPFLNPFSGSYVTQIPKSGREPEEVLEYAQVGMRAILGAI